MFLGDAFGNGKTLFILNCGKLPPRARLTCINNPFLQVSRAAPPLSTEPPVSPRPSTHPAVLLGSPHLHQPTAPGPCPLRKAKPTDQSRPFWGAVAAASLVLPDAHRGRGGRASGLGHTPLADQPTGRCLFWGAAWFGELPGLPRRKRVLGAWPPACPHAVAAPSRSSRGVPPSQTQGWAWGGPRKPSKGHGLRRHGEKHLLSTVPTRESGAPGCRERERGTRASQACECEGRAPGQPQGPPRPALGSRHPPRNRGGPALISLLPALLTPGRRLRGALPGQFSTFEVPGRPCQELCRAREAAGRAAGAPSPGARAHRGGRRGGMSNPGSRLCLGSRPALGLRWGPRGASSAGGPAGAGVRGGSRGRAPPPRTLERAQVTQSQSRVPSRP